MKLFRIPLNTWRRAFFDESPPPTKKLKEFIQSGKIPGEEVGNDTGIFIVYCNGNYDPMWPKNKEPAPKTGNAIADSILSKYNRHA